MKKLPYFLVTACFGCLLQWIPRVQLQEHIDGIGDNTIIGEQFAYPIFRIFILLQKLFGEYQDGPPGEDLSAPIIQYQAERYRSLDFYKAVEQTIRSVMVGLENQTNCNDFVYALPGTENKFQIGTPTSCPQLNNSIIFNLLGNAQCPTSITSKEQAAKFFVFGAKRKRGLPPQVVTLFHTAKQYKALKINPDRITYVLIHGAMERYVNTTHSWMHYMRKLISRKSKERPNVVIIDWGPRSLNLAFSKLVADAFIVSLELKSFVQELAKHHKVLYDDLTMVGFNFGAQIAGIAGLQLFNEASNKFANKANQVGKIFGESFFGNVNSLHDMQ